MYWRASGTSGVENREMRPISWAPNPVRITPTSTPASARPTTERVAAIRRRIGLDPGRNPLCRLLRSRTDHGLVRPARMLDVRLGHAHGGRSANTPSCSTHFQLL